MKNRIKITVLAIGLAFMFACSADESGRVIVRLTDSPGDYEEVNVEIIDVQIHRSDGNSEAGWESLGANEAVYNLLDLTSGIETVLADATIPAGNIGQIRLILGDNNTVVIDGQEISLSTPSASQSGLKINVNETLMDGLVYSILLDFDAARSVVKAGNSGKYNLKPVIRGISRANDGALMGIINPADESIAVYAIIGEDTLGTSFATAGNSSWFIGGLTDGTYTISFDPGELSSYGTSSIEGTVKVGEITDTGEQALELK
jgi:hypothetical protein